MTVGERIKNRRIKLGMTQEELAKKMGYSDKTGISKAETRGDNITTTKVKKFADALGCTFEYLMGWEDGKYNEENANFSVDILSDSKFLSFAKRVFYADDQVKEQIYSYADYLLAKKPSDNA